MRLLQHSDRWRAHHERRVDVRASLRRRRIDRGLRRALSRSRRCDRRARPLSSPLLINSPYKRRNLVSNLSGKTALVTGASRGIGRADALALAKAGALVLVHYSSARKEADAVVVEIRKAG